MAILTLSRKFNQWLGPFLLRHGLRARHAVLLRGGGGTSSFLAAAAGRDTPYIDALLGLPLAQWLVSLEIRDETRDAIQAGRSNVSVWDFWFHPKRFDVKRSSNDDDDEGDSAGRLLTLDEETEIRLQVLNKYLRPVLVGSSSNADEQWSNIQAWQFHHRFLQWARREYFRAKYGSVLRATLDAFPALRQSPQLTSASSSASTKSSGSNRSKTVQIEVDNKPSKLLLLPSTSLVTMALGMQDWSQHKNTSATRDSMGRVAKRLGGTILEFRGGALCIPAAKLQSYPPASASSASSGGGDNEDDKQQQEAASSVAATTIEDLLEVVGGHVVSCGPLNALCEEAGIYQLWTREYVQALGEYLLHRTEQFHRDHDTTGGGETIVLDVGAGDGLLCEHLRDYFQESSSSSSSANSLRPSRTSRSHKSRTQRISARQPSYPNATKTATDKKIPTVIATDNGSWKVFPKSDVEMLGFQESLEKYANRNHIQNDDDHGSTSKTQVIILCSWMPMNEDWSATFRQYGVDEYILIGECDDGQCGDNWLTWGNPHFLADPQTPGTIISSSNGGGGDGSPRHESIQRTTALYQVDGYIRKELSDMQKFQFSRFDSSTSKYGKTVSFRRRPLEQ